MRRGKQSFNECLLSLNVGIMSEVVGVSVIVLYKL